MLQDFKDHLEENFPELLSHKFLIACSGGLDSVVLAHLCHQLQLNFVLAHCNFKLRGQESDNDAVFVEKLAQQLNATFFVTHFNTKAYVAKNKGSIQMAARELRYQWFHEIMANEGLKAIVTAHHADDNLETFLINLSRGSGIEGLTGMPEKTKSVYRPLLKFDRAKLLQYAENSGTLWREDASNADTKYVRNKIRHQIIPELKTLHPSFLANFKNSISYLEQTNTLVKQVICTWKSQHFVTQGNQIKIAIAALKACAPLETYLYGIFSDYGFSEWNNVKALLEGMSGKSVWSKTHRLVKDRDYLLLSEIEDIEDGLATYTIPKDAVSIKAPLKLEFSLVAERGNNEQNVIYVAKNALKYPLLIRKWNKGDYFYPIGLNGKKKLAKFFKDEKVSVLDKAAQWLLCSEDKIVWVIGRRADNRFKVVDATTEIMKITLNVCEF